MAKYKILAPNKSYTGVSASVAFCNGVGYTENKRLVEWFLDKGYKVIDEEEMSKEVVSLATEVGAIKSIELENNNQGVEIWNDDGMLMLMPYGRGVVKV